MKWLFLLLMIFNLVVFIWGYQVEPAASVDVYQPTPGVKRLQLLSERIAESATEAPASHVSMEEGVAPPSEEHAAEQDLARTEDTAVAEKVVPPSSGSSTEFIGTLGEKQPERLPPPAAGSEVPEQGLPGGDSMLRAASTVAEVFSQSHAVSAPDNMVSESAAQGAPEADAPVITRCMTLGPLQSQNEVGPVEETLAKYHLDTKLRTEMIAAEGSGYWVVIPPLATKELATQEERKLREAGIDDLWRFTKGSMANAISLGLFSKRPLAERHARQISAKGFQAEVRPRNIAKTVYWLDFSLSAGAPSEKALQQEILSAHPDLKLEQRPCPNI